jgi:hypothetical protein
MDYSAPPNLVHLNPATPGRQTLRIANPHGHRVVALTGEVWLTQDRRLEDVVLRPGESYDIEGPGLALVTAFTSSDVEVISPAGAAAVSTPSLASVDFERYVRRARQLRAEAVGSFFARVWHAMRDLVGGRRKGVC